MKSTFLDTIKICFLKLIRKQDQYVGKKTQHNPNPNLKLKTKNQT